MACGAFRYPITDDEPLSNSTASSSSVILSFCECYKLIILKKYHTEKQESSRLEEQTRNLSVLLDKVVNDYASVTLANLLKFGQFDSFLKTTKRVLSHVYLAFLRVARLR